MKRFVSFALCLALLLGLLAGIVPVPTVHALTTNQQNIVDRANYLYNSTWVCQKTVSGWCGNYTFYQGNTYRLPYGQPINSGAYIGFGVSVDDFLASTKNASSVFYSSRSSYGTTYSTYYATDCSAFVSWCWGMTRCTTYSIPQRSTYLGMATAANAQSLQVGDCLNSNSVGHVVLVTGLTYSGNTVTQIEITEQTPPQLKRSYYTPSTLGSKYGSAYGIYRYSGTVPASPGKQYLTDPVVFNAAYYKATNSDLSSYTDAQAQEHWVNYGVKEGRCASPTFDVYWYVNNHSDLKSAFGTDYDSAIKHFIDYGIKEGRPCSARFNFSCYKSNYADLVAAYGSDNYSYYKHYVTYGYGERRVANRNLMPLVSGVFTLGSKYDTSIKLGARGNTAGSSLMVSASADPATQRFVFEAGDRNSFKIRHLGSNLYLGVVDGKLQLTNFADNYNFYWHVINCGGGAVSLSNRESGNDIDIYGKNYTEDGEIVIHAPNGGDNQLWYLTLNPLLPDGVYNIAAAANTEYMLDVTGISTEDKANIMLHTGNGGENQKFAVYHNRDGYYTLRALHSNKCVEVYGAYTDEGSNVSQYTDNGSAAQQWSAVPQADGTWTFISRCNGLALDIYNGAIQESQNIQCWTMNSSAAQKWTMLPTASSAVDPQGDLLLTSAVDSGLVAEVVDGNLQSGTKSSMSNQVFNFTNLNNGYYAITVKGSYVGVANGSVVLSSVTEPTKAEMWQLMPNADGTVGLLNATNGYYFNLRGGQAVTGADIFLYHYNGDAASRWNLEVSNHVHDFTDVVTPPTCTARGYTTHTCADCGTVVVDSYVDVVAHDYSVETTPATCTSLGYNTYTCKNCEYSYIEYLDAQWSEWTTEKPAVDESLIRSRTVYRSKGKTTTDSFDSSMEGGTLVNTTWVKSGEGSVSYASMPSGFNTGHSLYSKYNKSAPTSSETETTKRTVNDATVSGYIYWHWCYGQDFESAYYRVISPVYDSSTTCYQGSALTTFHAWESTQSVTQLGGATAVPTSGPYNGITIATFENAPSACYSYCHDTVNWFFLPIYNQTYTDYQKQYTYEIWGDWSDWSETPVEADEDHQVETRVEYAYVTNSTAGEHQWDEGVPSPAATCTQGGVMLYTCTVCDETKTEAIGALGHDFVNGRCTRCKETDGSIGSDLNFYITSIGLEDKIIYTALVSKEVTGNYDSVYVKFTNLDACDDRMSNEETDYGTSYNSKYTMYQFPIYVCQMTDRITATIYGVVDGETYEGQTVTHTVEDFLLSIMVSLTEAQKNMCANLLEYGAMMQTYFDYRADHLANDELGAYADRVVHTVPQAENQFSSTDNGYDSVTLRTRALSIGSTVQLQYVFALTDITSEDIYVKITVDGKTTHYEGDELFVTGKYTAVIFDGLLPTQADAKIQITVYDSFTKLPVSETLTDTLAGAVAVYQNAGDVNLRNAVNAMLNYYRLAETAFN